MSDEFGHLGVIGPNLCMDAWGAGPFVISAGGKLYRFEDSDRFGPSLVTLGGDIAAVQPGENSPFWRAHRLWVRQGRRLAEDGVTCLWDEPAPMIVRHLGGRHYDIVEPGEEDGALIKLPKESAP